MLMLLKNLALLFFEFFKAGLFAVGGGLATVPFIREILWEAVCYSSSSLI